MSAAAQNPVPPIVPGDPQPQPPSPGPPPVGPLPDPPAPTPPSPAPEPLPPLEPLPEPAKIQLVIAAQVFLRALPASLTNL